MGKSKLPKKNYKVTDSAKHKLKALLKQHGVRMPTVGPSAVKPVRNQPNANEKAKNTKKLRSAIELNAATPSGMVTTSVKKMHFTKVSQPNDKDVEHQSKKQSNSIPKGKSEHVLNKIKSENGSHLKKAQNPKTKSDDYDIVKTKVITNGKSPYLPPTAATIGVTKKKDKMTNGSSTVVKVKPTRLKFIVTDCSPSASADASAKKPRLPRKAVATKKTMALPVRSMKRKSQNNVASKNKKQKITENVSNYSDSDPESNLSGHSPTSNGISFVDDIDDYLNSTCGSDYEEYSAEEVETDGESIEFSSTENESNGSTTENSVMEMVTYSDSQPLEIATCDEKASDISSDSNTNESSSLDDNDNWSSTSCSDSSVDFFEEDSDYREFLSGNASDDSKDDDYENDEFLFIKRGQAKVYGLESNEVSFNSEDDGPQIIEIPTAKHVIGYTSDDSCPELVPIEPCAIGAVDANPTLIVTVNENHTYQKCPIALPSTDDCSIAEDLNRSIQDIMGTEHTILSTVDSRLSEDHVVVAAVKRPVVAQDNVDVATEPNCTGSDSSQETAKDTVVDNEDDDVDLFVRPKFYNSLDSRQVLLVLKSALHFHGILSLKLLAGRAEVYGYELETNWPATAYSPRGHSFINITPTKPNVDFDTIETAAKALEALRSDFLLSDVYEALRQYEPENDAILLVERGETASKAINMIDKYMKQTVFPNAQAFNSRRPYYAVETILHCQFFLRPRTQLVTSSQWLSVDVQSQSRIMVIGGKGVGKSTLVRHLVNRNLAQHPRILLIDLDIGQPEMFVPQTVSATCLTEPILGPGYMRTGFAPDLALLFGDINVVLSPVKYLKCVLQLIRYCKNTAEYENIPWIVNTMGYNRGFGLELTVAALKALKPTDLIQISGHRSADNFDRLLNCDEVNDFTFNIFQDEVNAIDGDTMECHHVTHVYGSMARRPGERTNEWDMSARDLRYAMILAHLGNALTGSSECITDVKPCWASLDDLKIIIASEEHIDVDLVAHLLNANLVYLCCYKDNEDEIIECLGIGIVRCVDRISNYVYLLPAIPLDQMNRVNALAVCNIPLPTSVLMNGSHRIQGVVPYVYKTDNFVGSKHIVQITYRPDRFSQNQHMLPLN